MHTHTHTPTHTMSYNGIELILLDTCAHPHTHTHTGVKVMRGKMKPRRSRLPSLPEIGEGGESVANSGVAPTD